MAHPEAGIEDVRRPRQAAQSIFIGNDLFATGFQWMKAAYPGFKDEQRKPYTFNPAPFLADKMSGQQGYVTSEPYAVEKRRRLQAEALPAGRRRLHHAPRP